MGLPDCGQCVTEVVLREGFLEEVFSMVPSPPAQQGTLQRSCRRPGCWSMWWSAWAPGLTTGMSVSLVCAYSGSCWWTVSGAPLLGLSLALFRSEEQRGRKVRRGPEEELSCGVPSWGASCPGDHPLSHLQSLV